MKLCLLLLMISVMVAQTVDQKTQGACSPAVNTRGSVVITCSGVSAADLKKIDKGVEILNAIMKQNDAQVLSKLDAVISLLAPLKDEVTQQRKELTTIQQYTEVSKLNHIGTTGTVLPPLTETTGISQLLDGAVSVTNNVAQFSCDAVAISKYRNVIATYPNFPFSYYSIAKCLRQAGDNSWRGSARQAVEILRHTTTIDGHHPSHDAALNEPEQALRQ